MAVSVTPETLHRLICEAEAERGRAAAPTLKRAYAQLAAGYAVQLARTGGQARPAGLPDAAAMPERAPRQSACAAAQPLAQAHWKL